MEINHKDQPKVIVVTLYWNNAEEILSFLDMISTLTYKNFEVVVVDNGSRKEIDSNLKRTFPNLHVIRNEENLGWGGGANVGIEFALENKADYVWLLNSDLTIEPNALDKLIKKGERYSHAGMLSPVIYYQNTNRIQNCGTNVDWQNYQFLQLKSLTDISDSNSIVTCLWGTALLIKCSVIKKVGLFNTEYFIYSEDFEYSLRVNESGFCNMVVEDSKVFHQSHGVDVGGLKKNTLYWFFYTTRNNYCFWKGHVKGLRQLLFIKCYLSQVLEKIICLQKHPDQDNKMQAILDGLYHAWRGLSGKWDQHIHMPKMISKLITKHPCFYMDLLNGHFLIIGKQIIKKLKKYLSLTSA